MVIIETKNILLQIDNVKTSNKIHQNHYQTVTFQTAGAAKPIELSKKRRHF